jgi:signal recognition particle subunit SRP68
LQYVVLYYAGVGALIYSHLHIPLMLAERAWALAMQLKEEWQEAPEDHARLKFHAIRRLVKATRWTGQLQQLAAATAQPRTMLEADAYHAFMTGNVALDKENWADALKHFVHAQLRD